LFKNLNDKKSVTAVREAREWPTRCVAATCYENVWTTAGFCDMKSLPRSLSRYARSKNNIQIQNCLKTFGSAMMHFDFERTAETKYQLSQC